MFMVDTIQVLPPSEVDRPDESASLSARVFPNEESAAFSMIVVDKYSEQHVSLHKRYLDLSTHDEPPQFPCKHPPGTPRQFPILVHSRSLYNLSSV